MKQKELDLLEKALTTLRQDKILPTEKTVLARMHELSEGGPRQQAAFKNATQLFRAASKLRGILVRGAPRYRLIFPAEGEYEGFDPNDCEVDPFSKVHWTALKEVLEANPEIKEKGRYFFAKYLQKSGSPILQNLSLGELLLLVQLAANKGWILFKGPFLHVFPEALATSDE